MKNNNKMKKLISSTVVRTTATVVALGACTQVFAQESVIAEPNWPSAKATAHVVKAVAEMGLGLELGVAPGTNAVIFKAMDSGKGDMDIHPEVWMPNQQSLADKYTKQRGTVTLSENPYEVIQGYCVTKHTADKYGIKSVYDLVDPDNARLFDTDGDGKGEIWIGASGWGSTPIEKVRARDYGFGEFFELQVLDETLAMAKLDNADKKDRPFVTYCYKPNHIFKLHDLVMLEEPAYDESKWTMVGPSEDADWYNKSSVSVAWPPATVHMAWSNRLKESSPELAQLLGNIKMESEDISSWIYALVVDKKDAGEYAQEWVKANEDKVNVWLGLN